MSWHLTALDGHSDTLIHNGDVVVGSIKKPTKRRGGSWLVEVLWSGPGGDIKGDFLSFPEALAFVRGVEKTLGALGLADPRLSMGVHGEPRQ